MMPEFLICGSLTHIRIMDWNEAENANFGSMLQNISKIHIQDPLSV